MLRTPILLAALLAGAAHAGVSASAVQVVATNHTPADAPFEVRPMNAQNTGLEITYLVSGENIAGLKEGSLKIESVTAGKDVKLPAKLAGKITFDKFFSKISSDGTYGKFSIKVPMENGMDAVASLKLKGKITVVTGTGTETATAELAAGKNETKAGAVTIARGEAGKGFFGGGDGENIALIFTGATAGIKEIAVLSKSGKQLKSSGSMGFNGVTTRYYSGVGPKDGVTIKVTAWKNTTEVEVPLVYGR